MEAATVMEVVMEAATVMEVVMEAATVMAVATVMDVRDAIFLLA